MSEQEKLREALRRIAALTCACTNPSDANWHSERCWKGIALAALLSETPPAGLSVELDWRDVRRIDKEVSNEMWRDAMKGEHEDVWKEFTRRLNALAVAKPAEPGVPLIHGRAELEAHEATLRKDVLEEAAQLVEKYPYEDSLYHALCGDIASEIRALNAAPAPAGAAKGDSK